MRKVFIAGGAHTKYIGKFHPDFIWKGHPDFGKRQNPTIETYLKDVTISALANVGATAAAVDRGYVGNFAGELFENQGHLGAMLAGADPDLDGKPFARLEGACASGGLALAAGVDAILAGADVVLIAGAEVQTTQSAKNGADYLARAAHYRRQRSIDPFTFPCLFARRAKTIFAETDTTLKDCAIASAKAYGNANRNPWAHMHTVRMTEQQCDTVTDSNPLFLENAAYRDYLRVSDCSQVSDGASALILCSDAGLRRIGRAVSDCIELLTCQVAAGSLLADPNPLVLDTTKTAARRALSATNMKIDSMGILEVHDCFTITEILMYEALGLAEQGKGARLLRDGVTSIAGKHPVNTGGGLVGFGHPVGATGVKQAIEIYKQMKGQCGDYQVKSAPDFGLSANMGGDDRTAVVCIYRNIN